MPGGWFVSLDPGRLGAVVQRASVVKRTQVRLLGARTAEREVVWLLTEPSVRRAGCD